MGWSDGVQSSLSDKGLTGVQDPCPDCTPASPATIATPATAASASTAYLSIVN